MKFFFKWLLLGFVPLVLYFSVLDLVEFGAINMDWETIRISLIFSFVPYFCLPPFFRLFKDLFIMWWEGNILVKIFIPLGMAGIIGRVLWMISLGH